MRALRWLALSVTGFVLLAGVAWWWLFYTSSGAQFVVARLASIEGLTVAQADGSIAGRLDLQGVHFANDGVDLRVDSLSATIDVDLLPISIDIVEAGARTVRLALAVNGNADDSDGAVTPGSLVLPFPLHIGEFLAQDIEIARGDLLRAVDSIALSASWYEDIRVHRLAVSTAELDAEADGVVRLQPSAAISSNVLATLKPALTRLQRPVSIRLSSEGDLAGADVLASVESFAEIDGRVHWLDGLDAAAELSIDTLELSDLVAGWPAGFPIDGELQVEVDDSEIAVRDSVLRIDGINARMQVDAEMRRASGRIDGHLQWEHLRWPLREDETRVRSESGDLRLSGTLDDWTAVGSIAVVAGQLPPGVFEIDAHGDRNRASGRIIDSEVLGGRVAGQIVYNWREAQPWQAGLDLENVHLAALLPDWPAVISGRLEGEGTADPFAMQAQLQDVSGQLREEVLQANGSVEIANGNVVVEDLRIEHGDSVALLDGTLMMPAGLHFDVRVTDLSLYAGTTAGELAATGTVSLADSAGFLRASARSSALSIDGHTVTGLEASFDASGASQSLTLSGVYRDKPVRLLLTSALADWRKPFEPQFEGRMETFEVDFGNEHSVTLSATAIVRFTADLFAVEDFCVADQGGASLCANANWRQNGNYGAQISLHEVPVNIVRHFADTPLQFEQRINGTFEWEHIFGAGPRGSGQINISSGNVTMDGDPASAVATGDGVFDFDIEEGRLLRGDVRLPFPGRGEVEGDFSIVDVTLGTESAVRGNLVVNLATIRVLSRLTSLVDNASGALRARVSLEGSVAEPNVSGEFSLDDGSFNYQPVGLELTEVNVRGTMDQDFRFDLSGTFRAGKGTGEIVSRADYGNGDEPGLMFRLRGERLTLVNVPDVFVEVDTDVDIELTRETMSINGDVTVPNALIKPRNITASQVNESDDVVIVAGELPDQPEEEKPRGELGYQGELNVTLGSSVVVDLDLATANITGAVKFNWQGNAMPIASGRYLIDGNIEAYGQVLDISEGSVHFPNVPADQPHIRVMAEREIFGNTQVKQAGVLIDGPIRRPTIEAYTRPHTTEDRALTLLVTGSDFDFEQGVGAVDFGTYIAPRLFVSYGVGVFERENIISARFDLARRFGVKATSGSNETGIDLNYRFEN